MKLFKQKEFSKSVKRLRSLYGISVREAAESTNVSFATFNRVENGSVPELETFLQLCKWLNQPPTKFIK